MVTGVYPARPDMHRARAVLKMEIVQVWFGATFQYR